MAAESGRVACGCTVTRGQLIVNRGQGWLCMPCTLAAIRAGTTTTGKETIMSEIDDEARKLIQAAFPGRPRHLLPGWHWCNRCQRAVPASEQRAGLCHRPDGDTPATTTEGNQP